MPPRTATVALTLLGATQTVTTPAWAGGIGGFLSPAINASCANHSGETAALGVASRGTGTADGNALGMPITGPFNQCGGADAPLGELFAAAGGNAPAGGKENPLSHILDDVSSLG
ncbi:transcription elongation factor [Streptomyces syringium]|uniref:Transcription elongation factor n=1 Tax=Streptomyces syringium TaxID=76729 RepID=A0ABS4YB87_9ACTN|nr:transcription elongation factor [Streptomyces syringium]